MPGAVDFAEAHQHEVDDRLLVDLISKVFVVPSRKASAHAVVLVHHASDTVEAEPIELVDVHPEAQVGQQEAEDFMRAIVEQPAGAVENPDGDSVRANSPQ